MKIKCIKNHTMYPCSNASYSGASNAFPPIADGVTIKHVANKPYTICCRRYRHAGRLQPSSVLPARAMATQTNPNSSRNNQ